MRRAWVQQIMGLPISVHVRGAEVDDVHVQQRVDALYRELRMIDRIFSTYQWTSQVSRLNRGEFDLVECGTLLREVVDLCTRARSETEGGFDPHNLPLPDGGRGFDPSGLVKGWAVERAARHLVDLDGSDYLINAGGDVLLSVVAGGEPWRVGIEDPVHHDRLLTVLPRRAGAVATSGTARRGEHIIDPRTRNTATAVRSATITGPSLLWSDVYATAAVAHGVACLDWLATKPGYAALLVDTAGRVHTCADWPG